MTFGTQGDTTHETDMLLVSVLYRVAGWVLLGFAAVGVLTSSLSALTAALSFLFGWLLVGLGREAACASEASRRDRIDAEERSIAAWRHDRG